MNIKIDSNFRFSVAAIHYSASGELCITLASDSFSPDTHYQYSAVLGDGQAEERPIVSLLQYARSFAASANIKSKTRDSYRLMCLHLEAYGDSAVEKVTTAYLQGFIRHLQSKGLKSGTVRLYFQKLASVLHDAYKNGLFDDRILQRVKRPRREQEKRSFLSEAELKRLTRHRLPEEYSNIQTMFLFSCMTGLRYSDVRGLRWKDVRRNGKHLQLEFHQQKTDTSERLPLCAEAETLLRGIERRGEHVFLEESNQRVNVVLKRWCRNAGVRKRVSFHVARHTFCVLLLDRGVPIYTVQRLMCHSDIEATKVYADIRASTEARAVRKMPLIE
ncbi:MAG: site-specific integrase [Bacteroidales bacterium]|nr:site-specific integrase [Bacteroidales bacterium]